MEIFECQKNVLIWEAQLAINGLKNHITGLVKLDELASESQKLNLYQ